MDLLVLKYSRSLGNLHFFPSASPAIAATQEGGIKNVQEGTLSDTSHDSRDFQKC